MSTESRSASSSLSTVLWSSNSARLTGLLSILFLVATINASAASLKKIVPIVGSAPGAHGASFRTELQLHNGSARRIGGILVFHPAGRPGGAGDPQRRYDLAPFETISFEDIVAALGQTGIGSLDIIGDDGNSLPTAMVRAYNLREDGGTLGSTVPVLSPEDAMGPGETAALIVPADLVRYRLNIGIRTLDEPVRLLARIFGADGIQRGNQIQLTFAANFFNQQSAAAFLGVEVQPNDSVFFEMESGNAFIYGATTDNRTNDPNIQVDRLFRRGNSGAESQSVITDEDVAVDITLTSRSQGHRPFTYSISRAPLHGTLSILTPIGENQARVTYTPAPNYNGPDSFVFELVDSRGNRSTAIVSITVRPVNDVPSAIGQNVSTDEDTAVTITLSGTDADGQALSFSIVTPTVDGTLSSITQLTPTTASVVYTPRAGFNGTDNFVFRVSDGTASGNASVTINVRAVNDAPFARPDSYTMNEDGTLTVPTRGVLINDTDPEGQPLTAVAGTGPANGTLTLNSDGSFTYVPNANFFGTDSFNYRASDGLAQSGLVTVTINVTGVNDAPSFTAGANQTVLEDSGATTVAGWATGVSAGPLEGGQTLTFNVTANSNPTLFSAGPSVAANGTLSFTPAANANGSASITINLQDNGGTANGGVDTSATQTFTITVTTVNDVPAFTAGGAQTVNEDSGAQSVPGFATGVSAGPPDESAQTLTFLTSNNNNALFSVQPSMAANGTLTYTPAPNAFGTATVTVRLQDNGGTANGGVDTSATQTFVINVTAVNDPPSFTVGPNVSADSNAGAFTQPGWATAITPGPANESPQAVTFEVTGNTNPGLFSIAPAIDSTGTLTFTPVAGAQGSASITIQLRDSGGTANGGGDLSGSATFVINLDVAPAVSVTTPASGAVNQSGNTDLTLTFSEPVNVSGNWLQMVCGTSGTRNVADTLATDGPTSFTVNPNSDFAAGETCTVTVFAVQVADQDPSDPPNTMSANHVFSFTVDAAPAVSATTPVNGATGPAATTDLTITFSEPVNVTGSWFQIICSSSEPRNVANTVVTGGPTSFTLNPNADFLGGETCTTTIFAAQVTDQDTNDPPDNMLANSVFTFAIDVGPDVASTTPVDTSVGNATNTNISITFTEPVNVTGNWFQITCTFSPTVNVADTVVTGGPTTYTINPNSDFATGDACTVTLFSAGVTDVDTNDPPDNMPGSFSFTFSTDARPFVSATSPPNGGAIGAGSDVSITFSEPVNVTGNWFQLACSITGTRNASNSVVTGGPDTFTINPNVDFSVLDVCSATIFAAQVADQDASDPPDNMDVDYGFTFTIDAPPAVSATTPTNGATDQSGSTNLTVTFSEPVNVSGNWFQIVCPSGTQNVVDTGVGGGPTTFTLNPFADFASGELCTVTVFAAQVADQDPNDPPDNMAANFVFSFTMDAAPSVSTTTPASGASNQVTNTDLTINFNEPVSPGGNWFQIVCGISGTRNTADTVITGGPTTFTINPIADFASGETCTVTVFGALVGDQDTNDPPDTMLANHVFSFTTDAAPSVASTIPVALATSVATNSDVTINFTENVTVTGDWLTLQCTVTGLRAFADLVVTGGPQSFVINPNADFANAESCTVTVLAANVNDLDGFDPPDGMLANHVFTFTADAPPSITATSPVNGTLNAAPDTDITLTFSEAVNVSGNWFQISCATTGIRNPADAIITGGPTTFTINPNVNFSGGESCTVTTFAAQVTDQDAGDPPDNMTADHVFSFSTDQAPSVGSTLPTSGSTGDALNTNLTITFDEPVNVAGNWFQIVCGASGIRNVANTAVSGGPSIFTINPNADFTQGELCTVTVFAAQVTDQDANDPPDTMAANFVFSFTLDAAPAVTTVVPANGATDPPANTDITVTFSEPVNVTGNWFQLICSISGTTNPAQTVITGGPTTFTINRTRLTSPFNLLSSFQAVNNGTGNNPAAGDNIFIHESATPYLSPLTLLNNQKLIGQDATATLAAIAGVTLPADSFALPAMNGGVPASEVRSTTPGVNAVTLASGNTLRGLGIVTTTATSTGIFGNAFGTLTVADLIVNTSGPALNLTTGTISGDFNSVSSSGGANSIILNTVAGTTTMTGTLSGPTGDALVINGGTLTLTFNGNISAPSTARAVNISNKTASGNVTINAAINPLGAAGGVFLDNNDGATITFRGGMALSTGAQAAFTATGGGTVEVCDENPCNAGATGGLVNTITTTTGTALNVANTTIGANNLEFRSISANGAANGIALNNTGATGRLLVKGNGGSCTSVGTCTGGAIQNTTSHGISMNNTLNPSFTRMGIQNTSGSGIDGTAVAGFTLDSSFLDNNATGGGADESNIAFDVQALGTETNLSGAVSITSNILTNARYHGVRILNFNGTISDLVITGNTITSSTSVATSLGSGVHIQAIGSASTVSNITKGNISNNTITNFPSDAGIEVKGGNSTASGPGGTMGTPGNVTNIINITGNLIRGASAVNRMGTMFIDIGVSGGNSGSRSQANFNISSNGTVGNPLTHSAGIGIGLGNTGYSTSTVTTNGNVIVANNTVASAGIGGGNGIVSSSAETPDLTWTINNNNISQVDGNGILAVGRGATGVMDVKIQGNTVAAPLSGVRPGIRIDAGNAASVDDAVCLNISGNTSAGSGGSQGIGLRKQGTVATTNDFGIHGLPGGSTATPNVEAYVNSQNPGGGSTLLISATSGFSTCSFP